ncbi:hypothetical protein B0H14DRAFT_2586226 [Mycena olivaceomarginata]|nr:hypothetical protein B0H14DRAFT_2586226 [Mycena olivaceomarginata]
MIQKLDEMLGPGDENLWGVGNTVSANRGSGVKFLELQICAEITQEKDFESKTFLTVLITISLLFPERNRSCSTLMHDMGGAVDTMAPRANFSYSTLIRLSSKDENLSFNRYDTLKAIIQDDLERFDEENTGEVSTLTELKDFITFILAPLTAALLIAEDMNVDLAEVHDILDNSNDFGDVMQPEDDNDEQVDTLHQENIQAIKRQKIFSSNSRHRAVKKHPSGVIFIVICEKIKSGLL